MRTTTRIVTAQMVVIALAVAACSTPQSEPAPASTTEAPPAVQTSPAPEAAPAETSTALQQPAGQTAQPRPPAAEAAAPSAPPRAVAPEPPAPPKPRVARLAAGRTLTIRTTRLLSTKTMKTGDAFSAVLEEPITVDGWVVAATGAKIDGRIVAADDGGRLKGKANLSIELTSLTTSDGQKIEIVTTPVSSEAAANKSADAAKVGIGAGAGAAVGAIAGGGKGAVIGGLIGGGAGAAMRGDAAEIPAEMLVAFELRSPVTIQERPR